MKKHFLLPALLLTCWLGVSAQTPKLELQLKEANTTVSPTLYGLMTEEINFAYEGGLYAQLIRNNSFKDIVRPKGRPMGRFDFRNIKPEYWTLTDTLKAEMRLEQEGINAAHNSALHLSVKESGNGVANTGYWGIPIRPATKYRGGIYLKSDVSGASVTVRIENMDGTKVYASTQINGITNEWKKYPISLTTKAKEAPTKDTRFVVVGNQIGNYWMTRVTLFPPTFNNRENGLRVDLMTMMKNMNPTFLRFPGGNYLEGNLFKDRFDWKKTIGDPDLRPGHMSPWGYRSTDGLGLLEFLEWAEDVGAEPLLGLFAGYCLNGDYLDGDFVKPFIQDALEEIEYVIGGADTKWGAQRIKDGHPEPFPLHYVEIGNEDWFDRSGSYADRYRQFYDAVKAKYPQLQIISTIGRGTNMANIMDVPGVQIDIVDEHYYRGANDMYRAAFQYDSYDRKGPKVFCGEWATREGEPTTNMNAALGDAVWMTCMERNSDVVIASCYAPLFVNVNDGGMQWKSDLIGYDALNAYGSPAYYAQVMFANNLGDKIVPIQSTDIPTFTIKANNPRENDADVPELYFVATRDSKTGIVYLKVVNVVDETQTVDIEINGANSVTSKGIKVELKSEKSTDTNSITDPQKIVPVQSKIKTGKSFRHVFAPYSVTVLQLTTK